MRDLDDPQGSGSAPRHNGAEVTRTFRLMAARVAGANDALDREMAAVRQAVEGVIGAADSYTDQARAELSALRGSGVGDALALAAGRLRTLLAQHLADVESQVAVQETTADTIARSCATVIAAVAALRELTFRAHLVAMNGAAWAERTSGHAAMRVLVEEMSRLTAQIRADNGALAGWADELLDTLPAIRGRVGQLKATVGAFAARMGERAGALVGRAEATRTSLVELAREAERRAAACRAHAGAALAELQLERALRDELEAVTGMVNEIGRGVEVGAPVTESSTHGACGGPPPRVPGEVIS